jgi:hypothetical protein
VYKEKRRPERGHRWGETAPLADLGKVRAATKEHSSQGGENEHPTVHGNIALMAKRTHVLLAVLALLSGRAATAQQAPGPAELPDTPKPKQEQDGRNEGKSPLSAPIGIIAKRSYVYPELATTPGALTTGQKFELFLSKSTSPPQILSSVAGAAIGQANNSLPGYGQEWSGYAKRFGSSLASGASSHLFGTFLLPSLLHEDPRYFVRLGGGWRAHVGHALARVVVIRTDTGARRFNVPGTLGPLMAEGLANVYLPDQERTAGKTFERFGFRIGWGAANNLVKEYWPTIFKSLRISRVAPELKPEGTSPGPGQPPGEL